MTTFKQYIKETPLPSDIDKEEFRQSKLSFKGIVEVFKKHFGKALSQGSSRVAFVVNNSGSELTNDMLSDLGIEIKDKPLTIGTVFKVAKNPKGAVQNAVEYGIYQNFKRVNEGRFLAPIIDSSKSILNLKDIEVEDLEVQEGLLYIQMAKCGKLPKHQMRDLLKKTFGTLVYSGGDVREFDERVMFSGIGEANPTTLAGYRSGITMGINTDEQISNLDTLYSLCNSSGLGDLVQLANWGVYKGIPVILDYGFDNDTTSGIYKRLDKLHTWHDSDSGNVVYKIKKYK